MENDKLFELMTKMYGEMQAGFKEVNTKINNMDNRTIGIEEDVSVLKEDFSVLKGDVSVLKEEFSVLKSDVSVLKEDFSVLKGDVSVVKEDISILKEDVYRIENKLDDIEANNADRHISMNSDIKNIKSSLSKVEIVTAGNWSDIAKIKSAKRHRIK